MLGVNKKRKREKEKEKKEKEKEKEKEKGEAEKDGCCRRRWVRGAAFPRLPDGTPDFSKMTERQQIAFLTTREPWDAVHAAGGGGRECECC